MNQIANALPEELRSSLPSRIFTKRANWTRFQPVGNSDKFKSRAIERLQENCPTIISIWRVAETIDEFVEMSQFEQILMRNYMLERFLERISLSGYKDRFILKGSMLVAAMVGLDARSTLDMDEAEYPGIRVRE